MKLFFYIFSTLLCLSLSYEFQNPIQVNVNNIYYTNYFTFWGESFAFNKLFSSSSLDSYIDIESLKLNFQCNDTDRLNQFKCLSLNLYNNLLIFKIKDANKIDSYISNKSNTLEPLESSSINTIQRSYCCNPQIDKIENGRCIKNNYENDNIEVLHHQEIFSKSGEILNFYSNDYLKSALKYLPIKSHGIYGVMVLNCNPYDLNINLLEDKIEKREAYGHLPSILFTLLPYYSILLFVSSFILVSYLVNCRKYKKDLLNINKILLIFFSFYLCEKFLIFVYLLFWNNNVNVENKIILSFKDTLLTFLTYLNILNNSFYYFLLSLICLGYGLFNNDSIKINFSYFYSFINNSEIEYTEKDKRLGNIFALIASIFATNCLISYNMKSESTSSIGTFSFLDSLIIFNFLLNFFFLQYIYITINSFMEKSNEKMNKKNKFYKTLYFFFYFFTFFYIYFLISHLYFYTENFQFFTSSSASVSSQSFLKFSNFFFFLRNFNNFTILKNWEIFNLHSIMYESFFFCFYFYNLYYFLPSKNLLLEVTSIELANEDDGIEQFNVSKNEGIISSFFSRNIKNYNNNKNLEELLEMGKIKDPYKKLPRIDSTSSIITVSCSSSSSSYNSSSMREDDEEDEQGENFLKNKAKYLLPDSNCSSPTVY